MFRLHRKVGGEKSCRIRGLLIRYSDNSQRIYITGPPVDIFQKNEKSTWNRIRRPWSNANRQEPAGRIDAVADPWVTE